jgi:hypothetical protein
MCAVFRRSKSNRCANLRESDRTLRDGSFWMALSQALRARLRSHGPYGTKAIRRRLPRIKDACSWGFNPRPGPNRTGSWSIRRVVGCSMPGAARSDELKRIKRMYPASVSVRTLARNLLSSPESPRIKASPTTLTFLPYLLNQKLIRTVPVTAFGS